MPSGDTSIEEIRTYFSDDRFATEACQATIVEASCGHAVCEFEIQPIHRNAMGAVMGGAIFTLADFSLAVASNIGNWASVSAANSIQFLRATRGNRLIATCNEEKGGSSLGFYTVSVSDDSGKTIALMSATCHRAPREPR